MNYGDRFMVWVAMMAAVLATTIVWTLGRDGVTINPHFCRYFVPVKHHPGIYTCSTFPRPAKP